MLHPAHLLEWAYPKPVSEKRGNGHMWIMGSWVFMIIHENGGGILVIKVDGLIGEGFQIHGRF